MRQRRWWAIAVLAGGVAVASCGSSKDDRSPGADGPPTPRPPGAVSVGILLPGDDSDPASGAVSDYDAGEHAGPNDVSMNDRGVRIDRTVLDVAFVPGATVGEINALLESVGGRILKMLEGVDIVLIKIPDPGDLDGLDAVVASLEASDRVRHVGLGVIPLLTELPRGYEGADAARLNRIDHQIAIRAPAAWTAAGDLSRDREAREILFIHDAFGDGVPNGYTDALHESLEPYGVGDADVHGYHVLGVIAGSHSSIVGDPGRSDVTGVFPTNLTVRAFDMRSFVEADFQVIQALKRETRNVVLNTSIAFTCPRGPNDAECIKQPALDWLEKLRGTESLMAGRTGDLEGRFLHVAAAGNDVEELLRGEPRVASSYNAARMLPLEVGGTTIPNIENVFVVESRGNTAAPHLPDCLDVQSLAPGTLSAIGVDIWSFYGAREGAGSESGTSVAAPQVAGVALLVWALRPELTAKEVHDIVVSAAWIPPGEDQCDRAGQPVVDAYSAVLGVDRMGDAPVRLRVFDVDRNRAFDETDLSWLISEFESRQGMTRDFSRFDLNGDGYTGGAESARFDLNMDSPPAFAVLTQTIDQSEVTFDETEITDWQVLCYYAYSPLYTGDETVRDVALRAHADKCGVAPTLDGRILFTRFAQDPDIFRMNATGTRQRNLTDAQGVDEDPSWSPAGSQVLFVSRRDLNSEIYLMNADGTNQVNLTNDPADDREPEFSPDGSRIVFERQPQSGNSIISIMNADGSAVTRLTPMDVTAIEATPTWSPNGQRIAFASFRDGNMEIYSMNPDGSGEARLTDDSTNGTSAGSDFDVNPAWSPDGTKIAFRSDRDENLEIYVMNADGSLETNVSNSPKRDDDFRWSPDGTKIIYSNDFGELYSVNPDGSDNTLLATNASVGGPLDWSPDGLRIVYSSDSPLPGLWTMNADGSNPIQRTMLGDSEPSWR